MLTEMERRGLVERVADPGDARIQLMRATPEGERLLAEGRARRVAQLAEAIAALAPQERDILRRAATLIARLGGAGTT
jgi:DNA-binding MarR family transcriptional regulator